MYAPIHVRSAARTAVTVVFTTSGAKGLPRGHGADAATARALEAALARPGFRGDAGEVAVAAPRALLVGLGAADGIDAARWRLAGAGLVRALERIGAKAASLLPAGLGSDHAAAGRAIGEGIGLATWRFDRFDGAATKKDPACGALSVSSPDAALRGGLKLGLLMADCANETRRLAATPPNVCNPSWVAKESRRLAKGAGLGCRVITWAEAQRLGMGGLVNVGRGSTVKPCMVILEHKPPRPRKGVRLALVGKTITYDTGGYSLKISNGMKGMKYDGNGGYAVLGAMLAIAARKLPVHVVALLAVAENMVSGDAYRPDDVITPMNGVTVEVTNTDAEGRLVLADALAYACRKVKPTAIVDVATLTGGVVVALGSWCAGMFCNDDPLRERIESAADETGEKVWRLPLWEAHRDFMRAKHADVWNSGPKRDGHPIQGAAFLSYFVDEEIPWAHLDIAGTSVADSDGPLGIAGPTGFGARLLTEVAAGYAEV